MRYAKWTPRLTWRLRVLFEDGATFAEIAACLGITVMAVTAQAHRMGLRRR
jgi:hypothetical protein